MKMQVTLFRIGEEYANGRGTYTREALEREVENLKSGKTNCGKSKKLIDAWVDDVGLTAIFEVEHDPC